MLISDLGEFGLIDRIKNRFKIDHSSGVITGIGDDAAVVRSSGNQLLMTTDTLVENVHFDLKYTSFYDIGWKLLAVNLSDIASMGGKPKYILITLGLKKGLRVKAIDEFYRGISALAKKFNVKVIGGDIVSSPKSLFFTVDAYGEVKKAVKRSGAKKGDYIYYVGPLGESALGLHILKNSKAMISAAKFKKRHLTPMPLIKQGQKISKHATSMIDNSDGLARCLIEICKASGVGAEITTSELFSKTFKQACLKLKIDPFRLVFRGGEDYGLMFTTKKKVNFPGVKMIGRILSGKKLFLVSNGKRKELSLNGFEHF